MTTDAKHETISIYMWVAHADILRIAAQNQKLSVPDYVRERLLPLAAQDAGVPLPELPIQRRGARRALLEQAAQLSGTTLEGFRQYAAERVATVLVEELGRKKSGIFLAPKVPEIAKTGPKK